MCGGARLCAAVAVRSSIIDNNNKWGVRVECVFVTRMAPYGTNNPIAIFLGGHSFTKKLTIVLPSNIP